MKLPANGQTVCVCPFFVRSIRQIQNTTAFLDKDVHFFPISGCANIGYLRAEFGERRMRFYCMIETWWNGVILWKFECAKFSFNALKAKNTLHFLMAPLEKAAYNRLASAIIDSITQKRHSGLRANK